MAPVRRTPTPGRIALFPGAFRPPHAAHLAGIVSLADRADVGETVVVVSNVLRPLPDGRVLPADVVRRIWSLYLRGMSRVRVVVASHSAIQWVEDRLARASSGDSFLLCAGETDLALGDDRFVRSLDAARGRGVAVEIAPLPTGATSIRAADLRAALVDRDRAAFVEAVPPGPDGTARARVYDLCQAALVPAEAVIRDKLGRWLATTGLPAGVFDEVVAPGRYWSFHGRLVDGRPVAMKHAGDGPKEAAEGEPPFARPRRRLRAERAALAALERCSHGISVPRVLAFDERTWTLLTTGDPPAMRSLSRVARATGADVEKGLVRALDGLADLHLATERIGAIRGGAERDRSHWTRVLEWTLSASGALLPGGDPGWRESLGAASQQAARRGLVLLDPAPADVGLDPARDAIHWRRFELAGAFGDPAFDTGMLAGRCCGLLLASPARVTRCVRAIDQHLRAGPRDFAQRARSFAALGLVQASSARACASGRAVAARVAARWIAATT